DLLVEIQGRWSAPGSAPHRAVLGVSTDSRSVQAGDLFFALEGERFDGHDYAKQALERGAIACVVRSERAAGDLAPLAPRGLVAVDDPIAALERLADWNRRAVDPVITAITGSVGKTTTKEFLRAILSTRLHVQAAPKSFNNRLGVALTLVAARRPAQHLIVEMGTSAAGEISYLSRRVRPHLAVITTIARAHLSGLGDLDGVVEAKSEIFDGMLPSGRAYLNLQMEGFDRIAARAPGEVRTFGWNRGDFPVAGLAWRRAGGEPGGRGGFRFDILGEELFLPLPGRHNVLNAAACVAIARDLGLGWDAIREGLAACRLPPQRLQVDEVGGVLLVDDSYNANPCSMASAIDAFADLAPAGGRRIAVLGSMLELGSASGRLHEEVGLRLASRPVDWLVTIGEPARRIEEAFDDAMGRRGEGRSPPRLSHFAGADETAAELDRELSGGDCVLLKGSNRSGVQAVARELRRRLAARGCAGAGGLPLGAAAECAVTGEPPAFPGAAAAAARAQADPGERS
ncbi:MAG: UDP-N-acetylmuramoyl-tripeptide--D-alanyl-D-alanine ligase, partial [Planctomycetes bacterium]|nr:UDP-N-acetylmuramoyl-tripeptide--D-alanyl-D-alanine ligase [Planctomycetota bacterium]